MVEVNLEDVVIVVVIVVVLIVSAISAFLSKRDYL